VTKLDAVRAAMAAGDWPQALRLAARFPDLGRERSAILDGWTAVSRPAFIRQLRRDPEALVAAGRAALIRRYPAAKERQ
jgi:hypothetical protein